jgi:hypothetical protein
MNTRRSRQRQPRTAEPSFRHPQVKTLGDEHGVSEQLRIIWRIAQEPVRIVGGEAVTEPDTQFL